MQTAIPNDPFQLLERSFDDDAYKRYQRDVAEGYNRAKAMRLIPGPFSDSESTSEDDDDSTDYTFSVRHSPKSLNSSHRATHRLPPTPPSQDSDSCHEPLLDPSMIPEEGQSPAHTSNMRASMRTPTHDPPTPEITPPQTQKRLRPPRPSLQSTQSLSQAESFVTARENQYSAASSRSTLQLLDAEQNLKQQHVPRSNLYPANGASDFRNLDYNGTATPTQTSPLPENTKRRINGIKKERKVFDEVDSNEEALADDFQSEFRRNVTVKRYRPRKENQSPAKAPSKRDTSVNHRKPLTGSSLTDEQSQLPTEKDSIEDQGDWQTQVNDVLYTHIRDQKLKRLSAASGTSTIVEAIVLSGPSKPVQNLRHTGRNLALRDDFLASDARSRVASESTAVQQHRLRHRKSPIPVRGGGDSATWKFRAVSSPELSAKTTRQTEGSEVLDFAARTRNGQGSGQLLSIAQVDTAKFSHHDDLVKNVSAYEVLPRVNAEDRSRSDRPNFGVRTGWNRSFKDQDLLSPERKPLKERYRKLSNAESTFSDDARPAEQHKPSGSVSSVEYVPRGSFSTSRRRSSLDPSHLLPSNTPLSQQSQWSDRTDTLEVSEARAINIYPHNNNSLVVVQQRAGNILAVESMPQVAVTGSHILRDEPGRPTFKAIIESPMDDSTKSLPQINSPLTNPRAAPQPPMIKFIPATPNEEVDRQLVPHEVVPEAPPKAETPLTRRQSLAKRARRYSESFIGPLRTLSSSSRRRYTYVVRDDRPANLHPFWRPRGFWDDFDSDEDDYYDDEGPAEPLPRGGDTSDFKDRENFPRKMSRRMPGFRGAGGFLLGNSLGINRHGTNNRRHYVDQPMRGSTNSDNPSSDSHGLRTVSYTHLTLPTIYSV